MEIAFFAPMWGRSNGGQPLQLPHSEQEQALPPIGHFAPGVNLR